MLSLPDILIIILFFIVTLWLGLRSRKSDHHDYLLGGRVLTLPAFVATTVSTWYGGILGVGEYTWSYGISNWLVFGVPYYFGALLFALLLSQKARKDESLTIPHHFEQHFGNGAARCAGILIFLTTIPGAYILIMGTLFSYAFDIPSWWGVSISAVFVVCYLWKGGFTSVVKTDAVQFALMFGSFILLTLWLLIGYGIEPLQSLPATHLDPTGGLPIGSILVWYVIALSTLASPNFFQRCFAAKTPQIAKRGLLISIACWCLFDIMTTTCGLYARTLLPDLDNPLYAFPALAHLVLPTVLVGVFFAGLFATVLSTLDSNLFVTATTIGRDLWTGKGPDLPTKTRIGLILGALAASCIALASGSVIEIWKVFGSVSAASLLIPILSTYYPKLKMSGRGVVILMILSSITTVIWFVMKKYLGFTPVFSEPLFAGGLISILCFVIDRTLSIIHRTKKVNDA